MLRFRTIHSASDDVNVAYTAFAKTFTITACENYAPGTEIARIEVDTGGRIGDIAFSLSQGEHELLEIDSETGQIFLANDAELDFETLFTAVFVIAVNFTPEGGDEIADAEFLISGVSTLKIKDVEEEPDLTALPLDEAVTEHADKNAVVGHFSAEDDDGDNVFVFIEKAYRDIFKIVGQKLVVKDPDKFDYETLDGVESETEGGKVKTLSVKLFARSLQGNNELALKEAVLEVKIADIPEIRVDMPTYDDQFVLQHVGGYGHVVGQIKVPEFTGDAIEYSVLNPDTRKDSELFRIDSEGNIIRKGDIDGDNHQVIFRVEQGEQSVEQLVDIDINYIGVDQETLVDSILHNGLPQQFDFELGKDASGDGDVLSFVPNQSGTGRYGNWEIDATNTLIYTPASYLDFYGQKQLTETLKVQIMDDRGGVATATLRVHIGKFFRGTNDNDVLHGGLGNDRIFGEDGDDILNGSSGNDWLSGGKGNDVLNGGPGADIAYIRYSGTKKKLVLDASSADRWQQMDDGTWQKGTGDGFDYLRIWANLDGDTEGGETQDADDEYDYLKSIERVFLEGGKGSDELTGGLGADRLIGNAGRDSLTGGAGRDELTGGTASDIFNLSVGLASSAAQADVIKDYTTDDMLKFTSDDSAVTVYYEKVDRDNDGIADETHLLNGNGDDALYYAILEGYTGELSQDGVTFTEIQ